METTSNYVLFTDGGARGNPGPSGIGYVITNIKTVAKGNQYIGKATNNVAEYRALILGLGECLKSGIKSIEVRMDSELVVKQLRGEYRIKDRNLFTLAEKVKELELLFEKVIYRHIPREQNSEADKLVNEAIDAEFKNSNNR